jgi:hypothetical protein
MIFVFSRLQRNARIVTANGGGGGGGGARPGRAPSPRAPATGGPA